jgi:hypothetical protein
MGTLWLPIWEVDDTGRMTLTGWKPVPVVKTTARRVVVEWGRTYSLDRAQLERDGKVFSPAMGRWLFRDRPAPLP